MPHTYDWEGDKPDFFINNDLPVAITVTYHADFTGGPTRVEVGPRAVALASQKGWPPVRLGTDAVRVRAKDRPDEVVVDDWQPAGAIVEATKGNGLVLHVRAVHGHVVATWSDGKSRG